MRASTLAILLALPALAACGEQGPSEEMRTNEGTANAPGTTIPDQAPEGRYETVDREGEETIIALPPGGEGEDDGYDARASQDEEGMVRDGVAYSPDILSDEDRDRLDPGQASLEQIAQGDWRSEDDRARDQYRNPVETLEFFGLRPDMTVVEVWPGGGWYTEVIAPYLAQGGGTYYAAGFDPETDSQYQRDSIAAFEREFASDPDTYGDVNMTVLSPQEAEVAPAGSADMVLTFRNVHNFVMNGFAENAFEGFYEALKPGGVLGVVDHRLPEDADDEMERSSGYVKRSTVMALAEEAGFEFVREAEINANPQDTADHPFGVWTLPPTSRTQGSDGQMPEGFDAERYAEIGESDRFTLMFRKPLAADGALME
ncbi:class I SAM-dependent methyltransferase [Parvularcula oceani]|uniref:class I SAM-dependent methyltransferase n=1 Tax=Parvularcula oceani TaxID=1247963 RepID=UPI00068FAB48|nr:class I SAM-dependent methyltransferase [Parvularcula oceani]